MMLFKTPTPRFNDEWFDALFKGLDRLHDAMSAERLDSDLPVSPAEMVGWLQDIIYTAQETIAEIEAKNPTHTVTEAEELLS